MRTPLADSERVTMAQGQVAASGAVSAGIGFNVTKVGTGVYVVRFPGLRAILSAVAVTAGLVAPLTMTITQPNQFQVNTVNQSFAATDVGFTFTVTGLPR